MRARGAEAVDIKGAGRIQMKLQTDRARKVPSSIAQSVRGLTTRISHTASCVERVFITGRGGLTQHRQANTIQMSSAWLRKTQEENKSDEEAEYPGNARWRERERGHSWGVGALC